MKYFNKFLLLLFSVLVLFGVSINTYNYVYADDEDVIETTEESDVETEKVSQTIRFVDEEGNPLEIEDTISIQDLSGEGDSFIYDENGNPEYAYQIDNGKVTFTNLEKGKIYYLLFDGEVETEDHYYVFKDTLDDGSVNYYSIVAFEANGEGDYIIYDRQLQFLDDLIFNWNNEGLSQEEIESNLTEIFSTDKVMLIVQATYFRGGCPAASNKYFNVQITNGVGCSGYGTSYRSCGSVSGTGTISCATTLCLTTETEFYYKITGGSKTKTGTTNPTSTVSFSCNDVGIIYDCDPGDTQVCSYGYTVYQTYDGNGGSCGKTSDSRTLSTSKRSCTNSYSWGNCSSQSWSGSVSAPSCSRGNGTDTRTISFNKNVASDSASQNVTGTDSKQISRTIYYSHNGWSGYSDTFTSNQTAYAQWSTSYGSWSTITLPVATRTGYTFKGWEYGGTTYSAGTTVDPKEDRTYNAQWQANNYTYTIKYVSNTGKDLGSTTITKAFDGYDIL